jgi:Zn-dependent membrane protease YugP
VYNGRSVAAAAVAAHECGHAVQHDRAYAFLKMRSSLVPIISFSSKYMQWVLLAGILLIETFRPLCWQHHYVCPHHLLALSPCPSNSMPPAVH